MYMYVCNWYMYVYTCVLDPRVMWSAKVPTIDYMNSLEIFPLLARGMEQVYISLLTFAKRVFAVD